MVPWVVSVVPLDSTTFRHQFSRGGVACSFANSTTTSASLLGIVGVVPGGAGWCCPAYGTAVQWCGAVVPRP